MPYGLYDQCVVAIGHIVSTYSHSESIYVLTMRMGVFCAS